MISVDKGIDHVTVKEVEDWAKEQGILELPSTAEPMEKMVQKAHELTQTLKSGDRDAIKGDLGGLLVVLIILARINAMIRLSLDDPQEKPNWTRAYETLRSAGIPKNRIRTYVLVGFRDNPEVAWEQCQFVKNHGIDPLPQWFHPRDALTKNQVIPEQQENGWDDYQRRRIMQWFYKRKEAVIE